MRIKQKTRRMDEYVYLILWIVLLPTPPLDMVALILFRDELAAGKDGY